MGGAYGYLKYVPIGTSESDVKLLADMPRRPVDTLVQTQLPPRTCNASGGAEASRTRVWEAVRRRQEPRESFSHPLWFRSTHLGSVRDLCSELSARTHSPEETCRLCLPGVWSVKADLHH